MSTLLLTAAPSRQASYRSLRPIFGSVPPCSRCGGPIPCGISKNGARDEYALITLYLGPCQRYDACCPQLTNRQLAKKLVDELATLAATSPDLEKYIRDEMQSVAALAQPLPTSYSLVDLEEVKIYSEDETSNDFPEFPPDLEDYYEWRVHVMEVVGSEPYSSADASAVITLILEQMTGLAAAWSSSFQVSSMPTASLASVSPAVEAFLARADEAFLLADVEDIYRIKFLRVRPGKSFEVFKDRFDAAASAVAAVSRLIAPPPSASSPARTYISEIDKAERLIQVLSPENRRILVTEFGVLTGCTYDELCCALAPRYIPLVELPYRCRQHPPYPQLPMEYRAALGPQGSLYRKAILAGCARWGACPICRGRDSHASSTESTLEERVLEMYDYLY